jgi:hypothetical protein
LSDTPFASGINTVHASRIACKHAPSTCGMQRRLYGSCTRPQSRCDALISLVPSNARNAAATSLCSRWPRIAWMRSSNGCTLPSAASTLSAPATSDAPMRSSASTSASSASAVDTCVPLRSARPFLRVEFERRESGAFERAGGRHPLASIRRVAHADQTRREVGERREVAGRADGTLRRNHGQHVAFETRREHFEHGPADSGKSARERVDLERDYEPHHVRRQGRTDAAGVRHDEVDLQLRELLARNAPLRELAETRVDAVDAGVALRDRRDHVGRAIDGAAGRAVEHERASLVFERAYVRGPKFARTKRDRAHAATTRSSHCSASSMRAS